MHRSPALCLAALIFQSLFFPAPVCRAQEPATADSLRREILLLAVRDAEIEADRTDLWHRLMPRVELSAGLSAGALLVAGPDATTYVLPRDAYRLSVSLGVSALFDDAPHEKALVLLRRRHVELLLAGAKERAGKRSEELLLARRDSLRAILAEELALRTQDVQFHALLFEQGKGGFDDLLRSRLALLAARRAALPPVEPVDPTPEER